MTTEPTDAELKAMWQLHAADIGGIFYYARAVLAKWGAPAPAQDDSLTAAYMAGAHDAEKAAAAELRRQHAEIETLRAGYSAARLEIESLQARVQELGKAARDVNSRRVQELEAQLAAVGAGGVEPLRKRCLHQISEPAQPVAQAQDAARYQFLRDGEWRDTELEPFIRLQLNTMWDAKIDAAIAAQKGEKS